jgi:hypothetical protein
MGIIPEKTCARKEAKCSTETKLTPIELRQETRIYRIQYNVNDLKSYWIKITVHEK